MHVPGIFGHLLFCCILSYIVWWHTTLW
jgi:hypothetical protein